MSNEINIKDDIDILTLLGIFYRNKLLITLITLSSMIIIVLISIISIKIPPQKSFLPNLYSPKSIIMLNSSGSDNTLSSLISGSGMGALSSLSGIGGNLNNSSDSDLAIKIASTNSFIYKLDESFNLSKIYKTYESAYPKTSLKSIISEKLLIELDDKSGMLEISYTDINKELATDIVNKVTELLEEEFKKIDKIRNSNQYEVVEEKKAIVEREMDRLQNEIIRFQYKHNILDVGIVSEEIVKLISGLQKQLLEKDVAIESYGKVANIKDPAYIKLVSEKEAILNAIKKLEKGEVGDYPPIKELPTLALELEELKRKLEVQIIGYKALIQQSETLKLTAEGTGPTFQVLEHAEIPEIKSGPSRGRLCMIISFAAFFISLTIAIVKEAISNLLKNPSKLAKLKGKKNE